MDILIFLILIFLIVAGLPIVLGIILYKWLKKKGHRITGLVILAAIAGPIVYSIYTAFYPTDSFYFDEFKEVTLREVPESADVIRKSASYPDFHGDYCSSLQIRLSRYDYSKLLNDLLKDKRITKKARPFGSSEISYVMRDKKTEQIKFGFTRRIKGQEDHYLYIGFLDDQETIIVNICVT